MYDLAIYALFSPQSNCFDNQNNRWLALFWEISYVPWNQKQHEHNALLKCFSPGLQIYLAVFGAQDGLNGEMVILKAVFAHRAWNKKVFLLGSIQAILK